VAETVSVIGLGKLGGPLAACLAVKGLDVIGVDVNPKKVEAIRRGEAPVPEPGLAELVRLAGCRLKATQNIGAAVLDSQVTFIVVPTPSEPEGGFSLRYVVAACEAIGQGLAGKDSFHLVVLTSTVMPGSTGGPVRETLERSSRRRCGLDFGLCYSPEFIALGSVVRDFLNPDFVLIGESDARSGELLTGLYQRVCENSPPVARMNFVNAELAKLAVNTFVTTKISFANMLARICERIPGADVDAVTGAIGLDSRIGRKYLKGAVSYGGPCFPRDNLALIALARQVGAPADIAEATHRLNQSQIRWLADIAQKYLQKNGTVAILGLTYKPNTDVVEESVGLLLARELATRGIPVRAYDPVGNGNADRALADWKEKVQLAETAEGCIAYGDVVILATPWPQFLRLPNHVWIRFGPPRVVIDCWRALDGLDSCDNLTYLPIGIGDPAWHSERSDISQYRPPTC
jgi:UDPglucose 6-dehydrogenase